MDRREIERIVATDDTVSNKIRALAGGGLARAEIARVLGKRYQHVRNVLEGDRAARPTPPGMSEGEAPTFRRNPYEPDTRGGGVSRLVVAQDGWVKLPADLIAAWSLKDGSVLIGRLEGDSFELITGHTSMRRVQDMAHRLFPPGGPSWADELIADRREEARREAQDD